MEADTPRRRIERAVGRHGIEHVRAVCLSALGGEPPDAAARQLLCGSPNELSPGWEYWPRVWGARGLLWAGPGEEVAPLRAALGDEHWRVREMACKVAARHLVGDLLGDVAALTDDPVRRVRVAAARAAERIVAADA